MRDTMETFTVQGINAGRPFVFGADSLTPEATAKGLVAKTSTMKALASGAEGLPDEVKAALVQDAFSAARIAQANTMLVLSLQSIDRDLRNKSEAEVLALLSGETYTALLSAMGKKAGGAKSGPLEATKPNT